MPSPARTAARRCWRRWTAATCSWSRSTTAASGTATTTSSPTCCGRTCWTSSPTDVADLHRRASDWYEQNGERSEAIRHALAAEDFERAADLVELAMPGAAPEPAGGHAARLARGAPRRGAPASGRCSASRTPGRCCRAASSRASRPACGTPSGGWTRRRTERPDAPRPGWSSWTRRSSAVCPGAIAVYRAGAGPGSRRRGRHRDARPAGARPRRPRTTISAAAAAAGAAGAGVLGERGPRGGAPVVRRRHGESAAGRAHRRRPRLRDRPGGHPDRAGSSRRRDAHLRAGAAARDRAGRRRCCGERRTCTWA